MNPSGRDDDVLLNDFEAAAPPEIDPSLQTLVKMVNETPGFEIGITLAIKGLVVAGVVTGWQSFFEGTAAAIRGASMDQEQAAIADAFAATLDSMVQTQLEVDAADPRPSPDPGFIHLRDAQFLLGTPPAAAGGGIWWRGRLSEVDGYSIGRLSMGA